MTTTSDHYRAILAARRACAVSQYAHVGKPLGIRPRNQRRWWRLGR